MEQGEMPIGFSMALAQNPQAMQKFAMLSEEKKEADHRRNKCRWVKRGNASVCQ